MQKIPELELLYERIYSTETDVNELEDRSLGFKFEVGRIYDTDTIQLKVLKINPRDNKVEIEVLTGPATGKIVTTNLESLMKTVAKIHKNKHQRFVFGDKSLDNINDCWVAGYVANYGYITVQTPDKYAASIEEDYKKTTGQDLSQSKAYLIVYSGQWFPQLRVHLRKRSPQLEQKLATLKIVNTTNGLDINDSKYVWSLFKYGFIAGNNTDRLDIIRQKLCAGDKQKEAAFNDGASI